jgi:hypothetical protein
MKIVNKMPMNESIEYQKKIELGLTQLATLPMNCVTSMSIKRTTILEGE